MTTANRKRVFGDKVQFKSLSCAPVNELGVVYLFGVLHDTFDFKIESIHLGKEYEKYHSDVRWMLIPGLTVFPFYRVDV